MSTDSVQISVRLSQLVPSRRNPRKVKPAREAHQSLVALIRSQGLLQPLVVRKVDRKQFEVVAGNRRLRALKEIHRNDGDPEIPCVLRDVDVEAADAMSLAENFAREAMHPLDEAEAFAKLATGEHKDAKAIAAEFGVPEHYVRQRMKLATLAQPVKAAHRDGAIDTATAEAFAAVPEDRQLEVWKELGGHPRHAEHVRNVIAHAWIDAKHALFDPSTLPDLAVSRDLFGDRVLVERQAFMDAQVQALDAQRVALVEDGWSEVVLGRREDVQDRLFSMEQAEPEYDAPTTRKLARIDDRWEQVEAAIANLSEGDDAAYQKHQRRLQALEAKAEQVRAEAKPFFSEESKADGTVFLMLGLDGQVHRETRMPRRRSSRPAGGGGDPEVGGQGEKPKAPTSETLCDRQLAVTFTHEAIAVREALLRSPEARKRVLALILHDRVRSEALSVRHEPNGTTLHATSGEFVSAAFGRLKAKRDKVDPVEDRHAEDVVAYERVGKLSASKLDALIDALVVDHVAARMLRPTALVRRLATELKVNVRDHWRPDAAWLSGYQKIQLAHLVVELRGAINAPAPDAKKSALVEALAELFADAAEGKLEDNELAARANAWLPSNLREPKGSS